MSQRKQIVVTAFALFSLFFGAGNLVLPPFLGYNAGSSWFWVAIGFALSAVIMPIMAIYGHSRLQGSMLDFGKKVSPVFALVYSIIVYVISISLPSPRTASVTFEMAFEPYFEITALYFSIAYFIMVLIFVLNRNRILSIIGKYITPLIIIILALVILLGLFAEVPPLRDSIFDNSFSEGILEGYQTFDAIGGVVIGGVIFISISLGGDYSYSDKRRIIARSGLLAGLGLFIIYAGLIALGALQSGGEDVSNRTELLNLLSTKTLGNTGTAFLAVLVSLACFTTAVGVVTGTADFVKGLFKGSKSAYVLTALLSCLIGVLVGQNTVGYIIDVAIPCLMFIYPITIVLIALSVLPNSLTKRSVYRATVITAVLFSIPDFLATIDYNIISLELLQAIRDKIPLADAHMGWILPSLVVFGIVNLFVKNRDEDSKSH